MPHVYALANSNKADFTDIYNLPTPIEYFAAMESLGYEIPDNAAPVFRALVGEIRRNRGRHDVRILDLGCSYGVNAALLKFGLTIRDLYARYADTAMVALPRERLIIEDRCWLAQMTGRDGLAIYGLDRAENAVDYGVANGFLDGGAAVDLEVSHVGLSATQLPTDFDLIISTGCVGYVTERTFSRIVDRSVGTTRPWIASFVLRIFDFEPITRALSERGYVTERYEGSNFIQRRFMNGTEAQHTLNQLSLLGRSPAGLETTGRLYADLFLSRPINDVAQTALPALLTEYLRSESLAPNIGPGL
jgi:SAM-dependent methyltransferase